MVAVTVFVGQAPRAGKATLFGVRWGVGHAVAVLVAGGALAWSGLGVPAGAEVWAELGVGAMLVALGVWSLRAAHRLHLHRPQEHGGHAHLHAHRADRHPHHHAPRPDSEQASEEPPGRPGGRGHEHAHRRGQRKSRHGHLSTLVGAAHGLAGTAPVVALIPITLLPGLWPALGYLAAFGAGTILAMGLYAGLAALAARRASSSIRLARGIGLATGVASLAVGIWWIVRAADALAG
ncbi:MAG: hypothetical protein JSV95_03045 [Gemmatimonadota bacterium]|nr:MAG: hypothetical protein JSV95_03045 [Gemmatimonadota bacterium]